jgi:ribosomal protein S18 acetylase RimI-like enzyme
VVTASLSFSRATREQFPSLQPPDSAAYLANIAVDPSQRRRGHARRMLAAAEALAAARGCPELCLHVRLGDEAPRMLYDSCAYQATQQDSPLARLRGITPRALMHKQL